MAFEDLCAVFIKQIFNAFGLCIVAEYSHSVKSGFSNSEKSEEHNEGYVLNDIIKKNDPLSSAPLRN